MIDSLQKFIDRYMNNGRSKTLQLFASKTSVSYSTIRRIAQGETRSVDLNTALGILSLTATKEEKSKFLEENFPEASKFYENVNKASNFNVETKASLKDALLDFDKFVIIALAGMKKGTTRDCIKDVLGTYASTSIEELIDDEAIEERSGRLYTSQEVFGSSDLTNQKAQIMHTIKFLRRQYVGTPQQVTGVGFDGVTSAGQEALIKLTKSFLVQAFEVIAANRGDIPVFFSAYVGSIKDKES